jgi:hypothetical protein
MLGRKLLRFPARVAAGETAGRVQQSILDPQADDSSRRHAATERPRVLNVVRQCKADILGTDLNVTLAPLTIAVFEVR